MRALKSPFAGSNGKMTRLNTRGYSAANVMKLSFMFKNIRSLKSFLMNRFLSIIQNIISVIIPIPVDEERDL